MLFNLQDALNHAKVAKRWLLVRQAEYDNAVAQYFSFHPSPETAREHLEYCKWLHDIDDDERNIGETYAIYTPEGAKHAH